MTIVRVAVLACVAGALTGCGGPVSPTDSAFTLSGRPYSGASEPFLISSHRIIPASLVFLDTIPFTALDGGELVLASSGRSALTVERIESANSTVFPVGDTCHLEKTLHPGTRCWIEIGFVPTGFGRFSSVVTVATDAGTVSIEVAGRGVFVTH